MIWRVYSKAKDVEIDLGFDPKFQLLDRQMGYGQRCCYIGVEVVGQKDSYCFPGNRFVKKSLSESSFLLKNH